MFLNNYYIMKSNRFKCSANAFFESIGEPVKTRTGVSVIPYAYECMGSFVYDYYSNSTTSYNIINTDASPHINANSNPGAYVSRYILFGSGTTPPTIDDVDLEHQITTLSIMAVSAGEIQDGYYTTLTIKNTSDSPITISEVLFLGGFYMYGSQNNGRAFPVYRTTFAPVTVPGKTPFTFTYNVTEGADTVSLEV